MAPQEVYFLGVSHVGLHSKLNEVKRAFDYQPRHSMRQLEVSTLCRYQLRMRLNSSSTRNRTSKQLRMYTRIGGLWENNVTRKETTLHSPLITEHGMPICQENDRCEQESSHRLRYGRFNVVSPNNRLRDAGPRTWPCTMFPSKFSLDVHWRVYLTGWTIYHQKYDTVFR